MSAPTADRWPDEVQARATLTRCPMDVCLISHHRGTGDALCIDGVWWHVTLSGGVCRHMVPIETMEDGTPRCGLCHPDGCTDPNCRITAAHPDRSDT